MQNHRQRYLFVMLTFLVSWRQFLRKTTTTATVFFILFCGCWKNIYVGYFSIFEKQTYFWQRKIRFLAEYSRTPLCEKQIIKIWKTHTHRKTKQNVFEIWIAKRQKGIYVDVLLRKSNIIVFTPPNTKRIYLWINTHTSPKGDQLFGNISKLNIIAYIPYQSKHKCIQSPLKAKE